MAVRWAVSSSNWSDVNTWNDGATLGIPAADDVVYANNRNITIDQSFEVIGLRNSALARTIATPAMTANNAPSPFVVAASNADGSNPPFRAFDRTISYGSNQWQTVSPTTNAWLSFDFGSGSSIVIDGYTIFASDNTLFAPFTWQLQGSDNNSTWTTVHSVTSQPIPNSGTYSIASIGNTTGYRYYRLNVTAVNGGNVIRITELELYQPGTAALAAGGSFIFNSGSISGSATSTTAALTAGATNLIQVTATTGSVGLTLGSAVGNTTGGNTILHSGNCNFNLTGTTFNAVNTVSIGSANCIAKTSTGTITITGDLVGSTGGNQNFIHVLNSTNGNTVVIGNVRGGTISQITYAINQTAGNVTVTGNVTAQNYPAIVLSGAASQFTIIGNVTGGTGASSFGINHSGTSGSVIGNVTGGSGTTAHGISTVGAVTVTGTVTGGAGSGAFGINTSNILNITGNINGGTAVGVVSSANVNVIGNVTAATERGIATASNISINVTGNVTAAATALGIGSTGTGTVNLTGNMINVSGRQAIFSQNLFISNAATSQWRLFTQGGQDKTLYSADTFPNQPSSANVRSGSLFGPANALSGSMVVPAPSDVRVNVLTDNTVGTGQSLTAADFLAAISSSADPFAERLRNVATVDTVGSLVTGLNGGF